MFRKEKLPYEYHLTLDIDNLWFLRFKYIPISDISLVNLKYNKEILRMVCQNNENVQKILSKTWSKILKQDLAIVKEQYLPKSYCVKVKDTFQAKNFSFELIINEISLNQLEFKVNINKFVDEDSHQDLTNYLKRDVFNALFCDLLIYGDLKDN